VRDFAQIKGDGTIDIEMATFALKALNVDKNGLENSISIESEKRLHVLE
jgi:Holliday junction resolvasome RuvABC ATP-dependent DNA helicase subunit